MADKSIVQRQNAFIYKVTALHSQSTQIVKEDGTKKWIDQCTKQSLPTKRILIRRPLTAMKVQRRQTSYPPQMSGSYRLDICNGL